MAKGNLILGTGSGKVGNIVFFRAGDEQRSRILVTPKNPRTIPQMMSRSKFRTCAQAYDFFKPFVSTSIPKGRGTGPFNDFLKLNLDIAPYIAKDEYDAHIVRPCAKMAPYVVAWGDMSNVWERVASLQPVYFRDGQKTLGMTVTIRLYPQVREQIFAEFQENGSNRYEGTLGDVVSRIAAFYKAPDAHLGLFTATGPEHDDFSYVYNNYAYVELFSGCVVDIPVTAAYMQNEHSWSFTVGQASVPVGDNFSMSASATNTDITVYIAFNQSLDVNVCPSAAALIAVERLEKVRVSRSALVMQDWMYQPYTASLSYNYGLRAAQSFYPGANRPNTQILGN